MARYTAETAYIASIYPGELEPQRRNYGPTLESSGKNARRSTLFKLEPVTRGGKPFILECVDSFEDVIDLGALGANGSTKARIPKPVPVESIVEDLTARWTGGLFGVPQGAKPGIMRINNSTPTADEKRQMAEMQTRYFEYQFNEGERLHQEKKWGDITDTMRLAAEWLDRKRTWSHQSMAAASEPCPMCREMMAQDAYVCSACKYVVRDATGELLTPAAIMQASRPAAPVAVAR